MSVCRRDGKKSRYRGVYHDTQVLQEGVWKALFAIRGFKKHLGAFLDERQAAVAYDNFSEDYRGTRPNETLRTETQDKSQDPGY